MNTKSLLVVLGIGDMRKYGQDPNSQVRKVSSPTPQKKTFQGIQSSVVFVLCKLFLLGTFTLYSNNVHIRMED